MILINSFAHRPAIATLEEQILASPGLLWYSRLSAPTGDFANLAPGGVGSGVVSGGTRATAPIFDGLDNSYTFGGVQIPAAVAPAGSMPSLSAECVYLPPPSGSLRHIIGRDADGGERRWQWRHSGTTMEFIDIVGAIETVTFTLPSAVAPCYLVLVVSGGVVRMYYNGSELSPVGSPAVGVVNYGSNSMGISLGSRNSVENNTGARMGYAAVHGAALSSADVADRWAAIQGS